jgi:ABC-2 type transport system ATP-binding protein
LPPVLEFDRISKTYRRGVFRPEPIHALHEFSLSIERGEIFGFLGPNGAGKTTAIHLAMGFMRPTSGAGRMLGQPFGDARTRARVGFLAEHVALYHRSARATVSFYAALNGLHGERLSRSVTEVLEAVDLAGEADRNIRKFSRGMLQRVGLAQALVNDPELLVLDEPTSALDPLARVMVRELLLRARGQGRTVFVSSHLLSEVELICDRVAVLMKGRVAKLGRIDELLAPAGRVEIIARGIAPQEVSGTAAGDGLARFEVAASAQRAAIERVWLAGGELVSVNPVRRSLENLFVELAREDTPEERR